MAKAKPVVLAIALVLGTAAAAYAFTALTGTTTLTVNEPLYVGSVSRSGALSGLTCTLATTSFDCSGSIFPGQSGTLIVNVGNLADVPITVTPGATSSSPSVTVTVPSSAPVQPTGPPPASVNNLFSFNVSVSQSAAPGAVTLNFTFSR